MVEKHLKFNIPSHQGNANQWDWDSILHQAGWLRAKPQVTTFAEERNTQPLLVEGQICTGTLEINMVVSKKIRNRSTSRCSYTTTGHIPNGCSIIPQGIPYTSSIMFIAAFFVTVRTWKQPRYPSIEKWLKKMWYIYIMKYYSVVK